jgi:hypothetical protein
MASIPRRVSSIVLAALLSFPAVGVLPSRTPTARAASGCRGVDITPSSNIQKVIDRHPKGTRFCFSRGVYRLRTPIRPKARDELVARAGVVLNGSKRLTEFERRDGMWVATNQRQQVPEGKEACKRSSYAGCRRSEQVFLDDRPLWQVMSLSALRQGAFYFDYARDRIYLKNDPRGRKVEASVAPSAIVGFGGHQDGVTVRGFRIEKFASEPTGMMAAIKPGNRWTIQGNEIRLNSRLGVFAMNGTVIRNNRIHRNGLAGIKGQGDGVRVIGNRIASNNIDGFAHAYSGGVRVTSTRHLLVRGNVVKSNDGPGLKTDTNNVRVRYEDNRVIGNAAPGISHEKSYSATIVGNYLRNNNRKSRGASVGFGGNITLRSSQNVEILRNVVVSTIDVNGIALLDSESGSGILGRFELRNVVVRNNVIRMAAGAKTGLVGKRDTDLYSSWGNRFRGNTYHLGRPKGNHFQWEGRYLSKEGWKRAGQDTDGVFHRWR